METPNVYISPFADWILRGLIWEWCNKNPIPEPFNEEDSWHWNIRAMHELLDQLEKK